jgi:hypothetical protein
MSGCRVCSAGKARIRDGRCRDCGTPYVAPLIAGEDLHVGLVYMGQDGKVYNAKPLATVCPRCGGDKKFNAFGLCLNCYETQERDDA